MAEVTPVNYRVTGGQPCLRPWYPPGKEHVCYQEMEPLDEAGKANPNAIRSPDRERLPCCACLKLGDEVKGWPGKFTSPGHKGIITKEVIDYCHPALEYEPEFKQAKDDDMVPSASWCPNNFAHGSKFRTSSCAKKKPGRCCVGAVTGVQGGLWYSEASVAACDTAVAIFRRGRAMLGLAVPGVLLEEELRREVGGGGCTVKKKSSGDCESVASMHYARGGAGTPRQECCLWPYGRTALPKRQRHSCQSQIYCKSTQNK